MRRRGPEHVVVGHRRAVHVYGGAVLALGRRHVHRLVLAAGRGVVTDVGGAAAAAGIRNVDANVYATWDNIKLHSQISKESNLNRTVLGSN